MKYFLIPILLLFVSCGESEKPAFLETNKLACKTIQDVIDIARMGKTAKDPGGQAAAMMVLSSKMNTGQCRSFTQGTQVISVKTEIRGEDNYICIRTNDEKSCLWAYSAGIKA